MQNRCHPPVCFDSLVDAVVTDEDIRREISGLTTLKRRSKESDRNIVEPRLVDFAYGIFRHLQAAIEDFRPEAEMPDDAMLDRIMLRWTSHFDFGLECGQGGELSL